MNWHELWRWEMIGVPVISAVGALMHFCYEWSGKQGGSAVFCAVNESVWEHMKIAFWPAFFYAVLEICLWRNGPENFILAKTAGFYLLTLTIPVVFFSYSALLQTHVLWVDIVLFVVAIFLCQWMSWRVLCCEPKLIFNRLAWIPLVLLTAAYLSFTFYPPQLELFKDPKTGEYGIPH